MPFFSALMGVSVNTVSCEEISIPISTGSIAAMAYGNPQHPKILGLHGWLDNAATFHRLGPLFSKHYFLAIDSPGHGLSSHRAPGAQYQLFDVVAELDELVDTLGWKTFTLLGHSLGGALAALYASVAPDKIEKLILIDSLGPASAENSELLPRAKMFLRDRKNLRTKRAPVYASIEDMASKRLALGDLSRESLMPMLERGVKTIKGGYTWRADHRLRLPTPQRFNEDQVSRILGAITVPSLLVYGTKSAVVHKELFEKRAQSIPKLTAVPVEGGHYIHLESTAPVNQAIQTWLST